MNIGKKHRFESEWRTVSEIARISGVSRGIIQSRLNQGMTIAQAATPSQALHVYTLHGKTLTLKEWAVEVGIPYATLRDRLTLHHWTVERALTERPVSPAHRSMTKRNAVLISTISKAFRKARNHALIHRIVSTFHASTGGYVETFTSSSGTGVGRHVRDLHPENSQ